MLKKIKLVFVPSKALFGIIATIIVSLIGLFLVLLAPNSNNDFPANKPFQTVFLILMENRSWVRIKNNPAAPYINNTLLPMASYTEQYTTNLRPSLPNYIMLEAGSTLDILENDDPAINHRKTTDHLVTLLQKAGISWKSYQEDIDGINCPLTSTRLYVPKHNPMVYFDDVTGINIFNFSYCNSHIRPYPELANDLGSNKVARYNFITPNLCNDMHDNTGCHNPNPITNGDDWLSKEVPRILNSQAYKSGGVVFITWDESDPGDNRDNRIGMIVLSPEAKGGGYSNNIYYTHSSTLRTIQKIFGVTPLLREAANATDLRDLFKTFPNT